MIPAHVSVKVGVPEDNNEDSGRPSYNASRAESPARGRSRVCEDCPRLLTQQCPSGEKQLVGVRSLSRSPCAR